MAAILSKYEFAVIGAGVFGAWLARALHLRGRRVVLIDQYGPANTRASSGGETRIIRMGYGAKEIYTRWAWQALQLYKNFDPSLVQTTGILWLCQPYDQSAHDTLKTFANCAIPHSVLTATQINQTFPQFQITPKTWGIWEPDAAAILARRGVQTVVRETIKSGLEFRQETFEKANVQADTYIYACGPWLPKLFPEILGDRIRPTRQEVLYFGPAAGDTAWKPPCMPCWVDSAYSMYGIPDIENRGFKVAIDSHGPVIDPDTEDRVVPQRSVDQARQYLAFRFPKLKSAPLLQAEVCQYENTANGDYLIDRHPAHDNVWLLGGGSGHGYKHGPVIGEYLADALISGSSIDPIFSLASKTPYASGTRHSTI